MIMTPATPLDTLVVLLGDSPRMPTGLGRISGDLAAHLHQAGTRLGFHFLQIGWEYGTPQLWQVGWPLVTFPEIREDWGHNQVVGLVEACREQLGLRYNQVVLLSVWDPARLFEYRALPYHLWGYFAVDGHNRHGRFGGPAVEALKGYDRVLGYTRYGAEVLQKALGTDKPISYLPHGHYYTPEDRLEAEAACVPPPEGWRLGCVAANQARKDLGLFFSVLHELRELGERVYGWLHTDDLVTGAWSVPELLEVYEINPDWVHVSVAPQPSEWLLQMYASCAVTLAPGRGEGFGYPIVESYAMGRAVVHCDYGGGAELVLPGGRAPCDWYTEDNPYCVRRPLLRPKQVAEQCRTLAEAARDDSTLAAYYAGTIAHLHWKHLWPRWETWVRQGLQEVRKVW